MQYKTRDGSTIEIDSIETLDGKKVQIGHIVEGEAHKWRMAYKWWWTEDGCFWGYRSAEEHPLDLINTNEAPVCRE